MEQRYAIALACQVLCSSTGDCNASMLATRATYRNREQALAFLYVTRHNHVKQLKPRLKEFLGSTMRKDKLSYWLVKAGKWPELWILVRIGQEAHVNHKVSLNGQTIFEAKGKHANIHKLLFSKL